MSVPFTRTLPYVLRDKLAGAGARIFVAKVAAIPDAARVTIDEGGAQNTILRLASYAAPKIGEGAVCIADGSLVIALGAVARTTQEEPESA